MALVSGRIHVRNTDKPYAGEIIFEPRYLGYLKKGTLYANPAYACEFDDDGCFEISVLPAEYFVHLASNVFEIEVPVINGITLKELLEVKHKH